MQFPGQFQQWYPLFFQVQQVDVAQVAIFGQPDILRCNYHGFHLAVCKGPGDGCGKQGVVGLAVFDIQKAG